MAVYIVCFTFILFDIITGLIKALYMGTLNSTNLRKGLFHKVSEVVAIIGSGLLEYAVTYVKLGIDLPVLSVVSIYICLTELISVLENLAQVNPTLAKLFKPYLDKLKNKENDNDL